MNAHLMSRRQALLLSAAWMGSAVVSPAFAQPQLVQAVLSNDENASESQEVFGATTAGRLFLTATLGDMPASAKVRCTWIRLLPAEQRLDTRVVTLSTQSAQVKFSYMPPTGMWAVGPYRIDLDLDGNLLGSIPFRMQ